MNQVDGDATFIDSAPAGLADEDNLSSTAVVGGIDELIKKLGSRAAAEANLVNTPPLPSTRRPTNDPDRTMAVSHSRDVLENLRAEADAAAVARFRSADVKLDQSALRPEPLAEPGDWAPQASSSLHLDFAFAEPRLAMAPIATPSSRVARRPLTLIVGAVAGAAVVVATAVLFFGEKPKPPVAPDLPKAVVAVGPTVTPLGAAAPEILAIPVQEPTPATATPPAKPDPFTITTAGEVLTLSVGLTGSKAGFGVFRVPSPPGIVIKLPHATLALAPGIHRPGQGFSVLRVQRQGRGTIVRLTHTPGKKVSAVIRADVLDITLRR